jgi:hypothetical protein
MDGPERKKDSNLVAKEAETSSSSTGLARGNQFTRREAVLPSKGRILFRSRWICGPPVEWRAAAAGRRWGKESELGASGCSSAPGQAKRTGLAVAGEDVVATASELGFAGTREQDEGGTGGLVRGIIYHDEWQSNLQLACEGRRFLFFNDKWQLFCFFIKKLMKKQSSI